MGVAATTLSQVQFTVGQLQESLASCRVAIDATNRGIQLGGDEYRVQRYAVTMILSRVADIQIRLGLMMESEATMLEMHDTMKPLEEEYQQQALLSEMLRRHESFKALNGKESSADPKLVAAVRRILGTWPSMSSDDWPDFSVSRGELLEDIEGLELEQGKQAFCQLLSLCDTLYFKRISLAESTSVEQVAAARSNALYRFARH